LDVFETIPPEDIWELKSYSVRREDTFEDLKKRVDDAVAADAEDGKRKWVIFNFHVMCETEGDSCNTRYQFSVLRARYLALVSYIKELSDSGELAVKTVKQVLHIPVLPIPRAYDGVDLPSDFSFENGDTSGASMVKASIGFATLLALLVAALM